MEIPGELSQLLTLALGTVFVTQFLKTIADSIGGKGSIVVSAIVSIALTLIGYGAGWVPVEAPACDPTAPLMCVHDWLSFAIGGVALANLMYVVVYTKVFGSGPDPIKVEVVE